MPVWFLSYRNGKRVSYSAVNGRTGKLISEIPISLPKFAACSALLTAVLFILLNTFLAMKLEYVALVAAATACLALYFCKMDLNTLTRKECGNAAHLKDNSKKVYPIAITFAILIGLIMTLDSFGKFAGLSF